MKQPELGLKISELRKSKGLTQEELVEQCNISVRTIQRIEAGEVTPRSYTIKTILSALDYDLDQIITKEDSKIASEFKKLFLLEIDDSKEAGFLTKQLNIAWISGLIYFALGFAEIPIDYFRYAKDELVTSTTIYILLKVVVLASIIFFMRGFVLTGKIFKNYLQRITAFIFIFVSVVFYTFDIISLFTGEIDSEVIAGAYGITYGIMGVLFGIAMLRLQNILGSIATITGIFEIVTYSCFLTIILVVLGFALLTPTIILEVIVLYKAYAMLKTKQKELEY